MQSKYSDLSKNTILFTISNFGAKFISFILVPLYTYILTTNDYGTIDLMTTTSSLLIPILTINIQDAVLRFTMDNKKKNNEVISEGIRIIVLGAVLLSIGLMVIKALNIINIDNQYLLYVFFMFVTGSLYNVTSMYLKSVGKVKIFVVSGLINTFLTCILNVLLLLVFRMGVTGYLIANILGTFIAILIMLIKGKIYKEITLKNNNELLKEMLIYSLPLVVNSLAWWLNNASDRYILTFFYGTAVNGIYAISYKIPTILSTVQNIFYNAWSISAIKEFDKEDKDGFIGNVYMMYSCISILCCSIIMIFNIAIAKVLYINEFFTAWKYVPFLLVGTVYNGIALFQGCIFTAVKKTNEVAKTTIIGAAVNTIFNFILIYYYEAQGAALATMLGYITTWMLRAYKLKSIVKMKVNWKKMFALNIIIIIQSIVALNSKLIVIQVVMLFVMLYIVKDYVRKVYTIFLNKIKKK